jgi:hypothetical protein
MLSFSEQWRDRCLNQNAITEAVYRANIAILAPQQVFEALNWEIPKRAGFRSSQRWNEAIGFAAEGGQIWQVRLDVPLVDQKGNTRKYESAKGQGARIYLPNVPPQARQLISARYGVAVPLLGSFWDWFAGDPAARSIPLRITEGGTKALSLLSAGEAAISLYGCSSAWQIRDSKYDRKVLLPEIKALAKGRQVTALFDADVKPKARAAVRSAICTIGKALDLIATSVKVATWQPEQGKGIDDFIAAQGTAALDQVLVAAVDLQTWKKASLQAWAADTLKLYGGRAAAHLTADSERVTGCKFPLPNLGEALLIDAAMGAGKTHWMGDVITALRGNYPDLIVDEIGHRNNLLKQTGQRLGLDHISEMARYGGFNQVEAADALAYCADSLWRRWDKLCRAIGNGRKVLLLLDELDALIKHVLLSDTIKPARRIELIHKFSILLQKIAAGGGWVIGGEAHLSALSVHSLEELSLGSLRVTVALNERKPSPWKCFLAEAGEGVNASPKQMALALCDRFLGEGKRVLLLTTAQDTAEQFDEIYQRQGIATRRIDSKTSSDAWVKSLMQAPGETLRQDAARLVIGSPSIESGLSIEGAGLFDAVVLYASGLEPATAYQMLGRLRDASVPRYLCLSESAKGGSGDLDPGKILAKWRNKAAAALETHQIVTERHEPIAIAHKLAADYLARQAAGMALLRQGILDRLADDGHSITPCQVDLAGNERDRLKEGNQIIREQRAADWRSADDLRLDPETARRRMRDSELSWSDRVACLKAIARAKYGDLVDRDSWITAYWADETEGKILENAVRTAAEFADPAMAAESDRRALMRQVKATGTIWGVSYQSRAAVIDLLARLNLHHLDDIADRGEWLHRDHWAVKSIFRAAVDLKHEVKEVLNLTVSTETEPMLFLNDLLKRRLGWDLKKTRKVTKAIVEKQIHLNSLDLSIGDLSGSILASPQLQVGEIRNLYQIEDCPHRSEMMAAIVAAHNAYQEPEQVERTVPPPESTPQTIRVIWQQPVLAVPTPSAPVLSASQIDPYGHSPDDWGDLEVA